MKIRCPACATVYEVDEAIAFAGAEVQCARCEEVFAAAPDETDEPVDQAPAQGDAADVEPVEEGDVVAPEAADAVTDAGADDILLPAIALPEPEEPQPDEWEATLDAWDKAAGEDASSSMAFEDASAGTSLLREEERALFSALLGSAAEADDTVDISDELAGIKDIAAEEEPPVAAPVAESPAPPIDLAWVDENEAAAKPLRRVDEIEVKEPALPPEEVEAEPEAAAAAEPQPTPSAPRLWIGWTGLAVALLSLAATGLFAREAISRAIPGMADLYAWAGLPVNVRGLEFTGLSQQWSEIDGRLRLVVRGEIVNISERERPLPELVFAIDDSGGMEFFQWIEKLDVLSLPPKGRIRFRAQIPAPPERGRRLNIRFAK